MKKDKSDDLHIAVCEFLNVERGAQESLSHTLFEYFYTSESSEMLALPQYVESYLIAQKNLLEGEIPHRDVIIQELASSIHEDIVIIQEQITRLSKSRSSEVQIFTLDEKEDIEVYRAWTPKQQEEHAAKLNLYREILNNVQTKLEDIKVAINEKDVGEKRTGLFQYLWSLDQETAEYLLSEIKDSLLQVKKILWKYERYLSMTRLLKGIDEINESTVGLTHLLMECLISNSEILHGREKIFMEFIVGKNNPELIEQCKVYNYFHLLPDRYIAGFYGTSEDRRKILEEAGFYQGDKGYQKFLSYGLWLTQMGILPIGYIGAILQEDFPYSLNSERLWYPDEKILDLLKTVKKNFPEENLEEIYDSIRCKTIVDSAGFLSENKEFLELRKSYHSTCKNSWLIEEAMHKIWLEKEFHIKFKTPPKSITHSKENSSPIIYWAEKRFSPARRLLIEEKTWDKKRQGPDGFFYETAKKLNQKMDKPYILTPAMLRKLCAREVKKLDEKTKKEENWIYQYFLKKNDKAFDVTQMAECYYTDYRDNIGYTMGEIKAGKGQHGRKEVLAGVDELDGELIRGFFPDSAIQLKKSKIAVKLFEEEEKHPKKTKHSNDPPISDFFKKKSTSTLPQDSKQNEEGKKETSGYRKIFLPTRNKKQ